MINTGKITKAAIIGHDGTIWASTPADLTSLLSAERISQLLKSFDDPTSIRSSGILLGNEKYVTIRTDDRSIYGRKGSDGVICVRTKQALIIAFYGDGVQGAEAATVVEGIADYLIDAGF